MRIDLQNAMFDAKETQLLTAGATTVTTFRYRSGVAALRVTTPRMELIILPFKGQQIWRASFDKVDVTMGSMFPEPVETQTYLETYGAFLLHCGLTAIGGPSSEDTHPLHGELPNAPLQEAWLEVKDDALVVGGSYRYTVAFTVNYLATLQITVPADAANVDVSVHVDNLRKSPMELMYLAHANFRPVDMGELIYSAMPTPDTVRVRQSIPSHISPPPGYAEFLDELAQTPERHHVLSPDLAFDPEVVFELDMLADPDGWAHALQRHPDGTADFISYVQAQGPCATRWICRTPDQQGLGMAFPSTAGVEGFIAEKAKGRIVDVPPQGTWDISMRMGRLNVPETKAMAEKISQIIGR
jgi:hypothetical protein